MKNGFSSFFSKRRPSWRGSRSPTRSVSGLGDSSQDGKVSRACAGLIFFRISDSTPQVWHPVSRPSNVQRQCFLNTDLEWNGNAFTIGEKIGSGSFATVFLGTHNGTGQTFAIKKVPLPAGQHFRRQKESLEREIMVLRECRSPYIVSYFGSFVDPENANMCIVMEFLAGGTLQDVVKEYDQHGGLDEPSMHYVVVSVLKGLAYLHERKIMHRDLKSKNILIDTDGSTKLADFGVSRELNQSGMARSMVGTPLFMAPEVLEGEAYSAVADVWSLGIVALHIANGEIPRRGTAVRELMRIVVSQPAPAIAKPEKWSPAFVAFVSQCLVKDPSHRATCSELLEHEWVTGVAENPESTKTDLRRRTIGRTSMYSPRKSQRSIVPTRAGAATPAKRAVAAPATPAIPGHGDMTPPIKRAAAAPTPVHMPAAAAAANAPQTQEELIQELQGWKQLALKLLDERERAGAK